MPRDHLPGAVRPGPAAELLDANEPLRNCTTVAAHELRTPLASILGFSALLTDGWDTLTQEKRRAFVAAIDRQSRHLSKLVDSLLASASIKSEELNTSPKLIAVSEAIERCLGLSSSDTRGVVVSCSSDLSVRVDPGHLGRILDNYLENAVKYGQPPVRIEATQVGEMVQVRVLDNGPGVPLEFVPRLFSRFARADTPATRTHKGTGLGLWIVRRLAEVDGGLARYEINASGGSCFVVELPAGDGTGPSRLVGAEANPADVAAPRLSSATLLP